MTATAGRVNRAETGTPPARLHDPDRKGVSRPRTLRGVGLKTAEIDETDKVSVGGQVQVLFGDVPSSDW
jgi:hypothetical protein